MLNVLGQWKAKAANPTYAVVEFIDILSLDLAFFQNQKFSKFGLEMVENRLATFIREAEFVLAHQNHGPEIPLNNIEVQTEKRGAVGHGIHNILINIAPELELVEFVEQSHLHQFAGDFEVFEISQTKPHPA